MSGEDDADKQHEPTQKKLDDARRKGEVPRSTDLNTAAAYAGLLLAGLALGGDALTRAGTALEQVIARADTLAAEMFAGGGAPLSARLIGALALPLAPFVAVPAALVLVSLVAQRALVVSGQKLAPKLNRISPLANAKNKFGRNGLFEFAKSFAKLTIFGVILGRFLWQRLPDMAETVALQPGQVTARLLTLCLEFLALVLAVALALGAIDLLWQRAEHLRKNRMSRKEVTDEHKQMEGDPHMKQQRRQRGQEIATNRMLADVPGADVVVVNPTHYAVALTWDRTRPGAPVCVAKGMDEIAARIRERAAEHGVPVRSDPALARTLHAVVEIGQEVRPDHYAAVAAAIRFAEDMRRKARAR